MSVKLGNVSLSDLFNSELYTRKTKPFQTIVNGESVMRTRHYFIPVPKPVTITAKRIERQKREKKVSTFIPLFDLDIK